MQTHLLKDFDALIAVYRQSKKQPSVLEDPSKRVGFRLLQTTHFGEASLRRGSA